MNNSINVKEIINLSPKTIQSFSFIQLPRGEFLLGYIIKSELIPRFIIQQPEKEFWEENSSQNISNLSDSIQISENGQGLHLFFDNRGDLISALNCFNSTGKSVILLKSSHNYGKTWSGPKLISDPEDMVSLYGTPTILSEGFNIGEILIPIDFVELNRVNVFISNDNGKSWHSSLFVECEETDELLLNKISENNIEIELDVKISHPGILELKGGLLMLICQIDANDGLYYSLSTDFGATWDEAFKLPEIVHSSKENFAALTLKDENGILTNDTLILGGGFENEEYLPTAWISHDQCKSFSLFWTEEKFKSKKPHRFQIYQDDQFNIHFLILIENQQIYDTIFENLAQKIS